MCEYSTIINIQRLTDSCFFMIIITIFTPLIVLWFVYRRRLNNGNSKHQLASKPKSSKYHCVEICSKEGGCSTVCALRNKRFLPDDVSTIPLLECDYQACSCHYVHHEDRRIAPRRDDYELQYRLYKRTHPNPHQKRSISKGRRKND